MRTKEENFITMVHAVNLVVKHNQSKWVNVKRFALAAQELNDLVSITSTTNAKADSNNKGATKDKHAAGTDALDEGIKLAKRASIYALDKKNMDLHDRLRFSRWDLLEGHDAEKIAKLREVYDLLEPIIGDLADYAIVKADLQHYDKLLDGYDELLTKPRELTAERKTLNQSVLPEFLSKMRKVLYDLDSFIHMFNNTPFEDDYLNARKVIDLGTRKRKPKPGDGETGEVTIPPPPEA
jgi:hypothetical protein